MEKFKKVAEEVKIILEKYPEARKDDHVLYAIFMDRVFGKPFTLRNFVEARVKFEGVSRARRRVQSKYPELVDKPTEEIREDEEAKYQYWYGKTY